MNTFNPLAPSLVVRFARFLELRQAAHRSVQKLDQERFELLVDTVDKMDHDVMPKLIASGLIHDYLVAATKLLADEHKGRERLAADRKRRAEARARERAELEALLAA